MGRQALRQLTEEEVGVRYKIVPDFPAYRVGTDGSVWSRWNRGARRLEEDKWFRLKTNARSGCKYRTVTLFDFEGRRWKITVHRLMLLVFKGPPPPGKPFAAHKDDDPEHNDLSNLRWSSAKDNTADALRSGRLRKGETHPYHKLTEEEVVEIVRRLEAGERPTHLAKEFKVARTTISGIKGGWTWKHIKRKAVK